MYKVKCKDCDYVCVGQTSRATLDENSLLAKHHILHSHQIDLESVEIVDRSSAWRQRLILEAWDSMRDRNSINEHVTLPNIHNNIKNFLEPLKILQRLLLHLQKKIPSRFSFITHRGHVPSRTPLDICIFIFAEEGNASNRNVQNNIYIFFSECQRFLFFLPKF